MTAAPTDAERDALAYLRAEIDLWSRDGCPPVSPKMLERAADEIAALRARVAELEAALRRLIDAPRYPCDALHDAFRHAEKVTL